MARKVFYSFHFDPDSHRAAQVRNAGVLEGNSPVSDNKWEEIKEGGDTAIAAWIDDQLVGRSCAIVLIGSATAGRKWIKYEIEHAWNANKGVVGIYIHNLKNLAGEQSSKGASPFTPFSVCAGKKQLSSVVKAYNPNTTDSKTAYKIIADNIAHWVEEAIEIRQSFSC